MISETTPDAAARALKKRGYRSDAELKMREAIEAWGRAKWPSARVVHELVMDRGTVRADVAFVSIDHLVAVEIKSEYDDTSRLLQQAGMFRLAVPELWIASPHRHARDAELVRYLMPSIGIALTDRDRQIGPLPDEFTVEDVQPATSFAPYPEAALSLLWRDELLAEAQRASVLQGGTARLTHAQILRHMLKLAWPEQLAAVCRQLRARDAFWRADPPVHDVA